MLHPDPRPRFAGRISAARRQGRHFLAAADTQPARGHQPDGAGLLSPSAIPQRVLVDLREAISEGRLEE